MTDNILFFMWLTQNDLPFFVKFGKMTHQKILSYITDVLWSVMMDDSALKMREEKKMLKLTKKIFPFEI